jgi:hypothetical protein
MVRMRWTAVPLATIILPLHIACGEPDAFPGGSYEIISRLELPHVERWAIDQTRRICLVSNLKENEIPIPVLSANNPFAKCGSANLSIRGATIEYDIVCPGRASAKAHANYILDAVGFSGRVAMVLGGKNMTMTEVVHARRLGACDPEHPDAPDNAAASVAAN